MRWLLLCCMVLCVPSPALSNPQPYYDAIHIDVGNGSPCLWPAPGDTFTVRLYLTNLWYGLGGMYGVQFGLHRTFGGSELAVHNLYSHLGGLSLGDPEVAPGFAMTVGATCVWPNSHGDIPFATVKYLYTGPPGTLEPIPYQAADGGVFADCNNELYLWGPDGYTPGTVAGIGVVPPLGCGPDAVEDMTWGSIKALYR